MPGGLRRAGSRLDDEDAADLPSTTARASRPPPAQGQITDTMRRACWRCQFDIRREANGLAEGPQVHASEEGEGRADRRRPA
jgi:hypothetical protein